MRRTLRWQKKAQRRCARRKNQKGGFLNRYGFAYT